VNNPAADPPITATLRRAVRAVRTGPVTVACSAVVLDKGPRAWNCVDGICTRAEREDKAAPRNRLRFGSISYAHYLANAAARLLERPARNGALNMSTPPFDTWLRW